MPSRASEEQRADAFDKARLRPLVERASSSSLALADFSPPSPARLMPEPLSPLFDEASAAREQHEALDRRAYDLQRIASSMIDEAYHRENPDALGVAPDSVCHCGDPLFIGHAGVYRNEDGNYHFDRVQCRSWACPVCAPKRDVLRRTEIMEALVAASEAGHKALFLTFTMPHWSRDTCKKTRQSMQEAYTKMQRRSRFRRVLGEHGFVHQIRCWDFTYGDNGWHPHIHAIYLFDTDEDSEELSIRLAKVIEEQWGEQVRTTAGRTVSRKHGFVCEPIAMDLRDPDETARAVAYYTVKRISAYSTDPEKNGEKGRSPFSFLVPKTAPDYERSARTFLDYYRGQKGIRRVRMSPGLRGDYGIDVARHEPPKQTRIADILPHHVRFLSNVRNFQEFSERGRSFGDREALSWLDEKAGEQLAESLSLDDDPRRDANGDGVSLSIIDERLVELSGRSLLPRDEVIDFLAGESSDAEPFESYADRVRYLAIEQASRIEAMYASRERALEVSARVLENRKRALHRRDAAELDSLTLPREARPLSGLGRALLQVDTVAAGGYGADRDEAYWRLVDGDDAYEPYVPASDLWYPYLPDPLLS